MLRLLKRAFILRLAIDMTKKITKGVVNRGATQVLTLLLLLMYITGTSQLELVHSLAHDHVSLISHSQEQEEDPCHRLIYHNDVENGCGHDSHLIVTDKCHMCDLTLHCVQSLISSVTIDPPAVGDAEFVIYNADEASYRAIISSSRAPPVLI
jgi:hypothetical protein